MRFRVSSSWHRCWPQVSITSAENARPAAFDDAWKRLDKLLIKPIDRSSREPALFGADLTHDERIVLRARRADARICIEVEDTGPGMNEAECARLFQRFSQTSFGAGLGGSGLGLSIVHQLAQLMDGEVGLR